MKKLILTVLTMTLAVSAANAKWWIFGKAKDPVQIKYLYINNIASDELGRDVTIYRRSLINGGIEFRGKAKAAKGDIGSVRISLDGKETWTDAKFAPDGAFQYFFKPEPGKKYVMYIEAMDTSGETNKVDETRLGISVSDEDPWTSVKESLDGLIQAYNEEKPGKFMAGVADDFAGDKVMLERAVRDDFSALSGIQLRYTINNISSGAGGRIFVSIKYNRMVFINKTGASSTDSGDTELVFKQENGKLRLYSMKRPLIFGLSDVGSVATGVVMGESAGLALDSAGELSAAKTETVTKANDGNDMVSYNFAEDAAYSEGGTIPGDASLLINGDIAFQSAHVIDSSHRQVQIKEIIGKSIDDLTLADMTGLSYLDNTLYTPASAAGHTYGVRVDNNKYYAIEFVSFSAYLPPYTATFRVRSF